MITTNDTQINSLRNLKRNMHRYGINSSMLLITLILLNQNSSNCINLIALIKNSILSKILRDIINSKEEKSNEMRIENILLHINAICAPRLITKKEFSSIYNSLLAHLNAYLFKTRIIDFNLGINVLDDINLRFFCEDLISNARRTTFNFAKCMDLDRCRGAGIHQQSIMWNISVPHPQPVFHLSFTSSRTSYMGPSNG